MDRLELIAQARALDPDIPVIREGPGRFDGIAAPFIELVGALEVMHGHGCADEESGDTDAPTGHFYRVEKWIVRTDERGFLDFGEFASAEEAHDEFAREDARYGEWVRIEEEPC